MRIFATELATADTYFLVSRRRDAGRPEIQALAQWALTQFRDPVESVVAVGGARG